MNEKMVSEPKEVKSCDNCKHYSDINGCAIAKGVPCARTGKEGDKYGDGTWEFWNITPIPFDYEKWKIEKLKEFEDNFTLIHSQYYFGSNESVETYQGNGKITQFLSSALDINLECSGLFNPK